MAEQQTVAQTLLRDGREVLIRPLEEDDYEALLAFGLSIPNDDRLYLEYDTRNADIIVRLTNAYAAENWRQIVATAGDTIVGYCMARLLPGWSSHVADIQLIVDDSWRGGGLGTALVHAIVEAVCDLGVDKVVVEVLEEQRAGRALFERLGFSLEGVLSNYANDCFGRRHTVLIFACGIR